MLEIGSFDPEIASGCNAAFCCIGTSFYDVFKKSKAAEYRAVDFGIATEFAKFAYRAGVQFFTVITGEGADSNSSSNMYRVKGETEDCVKGIGFERVVLIFATPLYWYTFPAQLKSAIDRMLSLAMTDRLGHIKETALLACAATENSADFDALVKTYESIANYLHWTDVGQLLVTEVYEAKDILKTDALSKAQALGKNISCKTT
jgi:hypothetical protein